jgi:hypothetical protein
VDTDLVLTSGLLLGLLSVPSLLSAWAEVRVPRLGAVMVLGAFGLVLTALMVRPGGYGFNEVPDVVLGVFARLVN